MFVNTCTFVFKSRSKTIHGVQAQDYYFILPSDAQLPRGRETELCKYGQYSLSHLSYTVHCHDPMDSSDDEPYGQRLKSGHILHNKQNKYPTHRMTILSPTTTTQTQNLIAKQNIHIFKNFHKTPKIPQSQSPQNKK